MADHLVQNATAGIGRLLSYLDVVHGDIEEARAFLKLLGWDLPPGLDDIGLAALDLGDFLTKLDAVLGASDAEWNDDLAGGAASPTLPSPSVSFSSLRFRIWLTPCPPNWHLSASTWTARRSTRNFPGRLFDFLVANYLAQASPLAYAVLHLMNIIDYPYYAADPATFQVQHVRATVHYHLFKVLVTEPNRLFTEAYGWDTPDFQSTLFLNRVSQLFQTLPRAT
ncbi:MAG: hypothetical protein MRJ92_11025 [Nitrospira sp.]|nr:hypothetical protein [Nitrospira sp.]